MSIKLKRSYDKPDPSDGYRILVDRIWPRGKSKDELQIDEWLKEVAPSNELRKKFHSGELTWSGFRKLYLIELKTHKETIKQVMQLSNEKQVTFVFSAKDVERNNAVILKQYCKCLAPKLK